MTAILNETQHMTAAERDLAVPELSRIFRNGLIGDLKNSTRVAQACNHNPSNNFGERLQRFQTVLDVAVEEERELARTSRFVHRTLQSTNRRAIGYRQAATVSGATFLATGAQDDLSNQLQAQATVAAPSALPALPPPPQGFVPPPAPAAAAPLPPTATQAMTFQAHVECCLSSAEMALRGASNTNAPRKCWGDCGGYHLYRDCPHKNEPAVREAFRRNWDAHLADRKEKEKSRFNPNHYRREGLVSKQAASLVNQVLEENISANTRKALLMDLVAEVARHHPNLLTEPRETQSGRVRTRSQGPSNGPPLAFMFWQIEEDPSGSGHRVSALSRATWNHDGGNGLLSNWLEQSQTPLVGVAQAGDDVVYPIAPQLPHVCVPIGKGKEATVEGLADTGGACNMADEAYFLALAAKYPELIQNVQRLEDYQERNIVIGGVGQGKVEITTIMSIHLPWQVNGQETRLVIGLAKNMPVTLLIGLPFFIAAQCTLDIANQRCVSNVFNTTWPLTFKIPFKKTVRELDQAAGSGVGRLALAASSDLEVIDVDEEPPRKRQKKIRFAFPVSGGFEEEEE
jgi:hypothetical protein